MFRKNSWKAIYPIFLLNCFSFTGISAAELDESTVARILSKHSTELQSSQMKFVSAQSPTSHTVKETVSISFSFSFDRPEVLISGEPWKNDTYLNEIFIERYNDLKLNSVRNISYGPITGIIFDGDLFKTGKESLMLYCREEFEKKMLRQYLKISETSQLPLEELKKEKAKIDIFGCQLLVEEVTKPVVYKYINDALSYYLDIYNLDVSAFTNSPFLYTLMRMLIDHSEKLAETIKVKLASVLETLGKTYSIGKFYDAGRDIYEWMLKHDPDALGEYHM